jgi:hypothetical protein
MAKRASVLYAALLFGIGAALKAGGDLLDEF